MSDWKKFLLVILGLVVVGWLAASKVLLINQNPVSKEVEQANPKTQQQKLLIGKTSILVEVRQSAEEQAMGLSWRKTLGSNEGMLFAYPSTQRVLYWMKGMQFPLDFIWIANDMVVQVTENVPNPTLEQPLIRTVVPTQPIDAVVEVNQGFVAQHGIKAGDAVAFEK